MTSTIIKRVIGILAAVALAIGISAGAAAPASAKKNVWDRVAACESGGRWKINTGNGYYGGLQFSGSTWRAYGGKKYASLAHRASRSEQIAIARRVLAGQGPGAWPTCSRKAGLTRSNGKASRRATPSSNPGSFSSAKSSGESKLDKRKAKAKKGKLKAKKNNAKAKKYSRSKHAGKKTARLQRGDTLVKFAKRHDVSGGWKAVWKMNKKKMRSLRHVYIGQRLRIR